MVNLQSVAVYLREVFFTLIVDSIIMKVSYHHFILGSDEQNVGYKYLNVGYVL